MSRDDGLLNDVLCYEHRVWQAVIEKDAETLADLFSDDYVEIRLDGERVLKSDVVSQSPQVDEIEAYTIESEFIRPLGDDVVLLSYHLTLIGRCRGVEIDPKDRWTTSIWRRQEGGWRCCFFQQSSYAG
ncbi:MAG: hypothetical protein CMJ78_12420 [Planctomycetaceae bacterium]|nr:hypothetical protein [Planctomycetaceae bacterium]